MTVSFTAARARFRSASGLLDRLAFAAFALLALIFPFEWGMPLIRMGSLSVLSDVETVMAVGLILWVLSRLAARRAPLFPRRLAWPVLMWLAVLALAALVAPSHRADVWRFVLRMAGGALVGWAAYDISGPTLSDADGARRWYTLARAVALAGVAVAFFGLAEMAGVQPVTAWLAGFKAAPTRVGDLLRLSSTLAYATIAAMVLELTAPLLIAWVLTARRVSVRIIMGAALVASLLALILTLTRSGVAALLVALVLATGVAWRWARRAAFGLLASGFLLIVIGAGYFLNNPLLRLRISSETEAQWYQAVYTATSDLVARPGQVAIVPVLVANTGLRTWRAHDAQQFELGYHVLGPDGAPVTYDGARTVLPGDVAPGETLTVQAALVAPVTAGEYVVEWDMVQEEVTWFSWKGAPAARTHLTVAGQPEPGPAVPVSQQPPPAARLLLPAPVRLDLWRAAGRMFLAYPLLGVGPDNFRLVYGNYAGLEQWDIGIHANNLYIEWLADAGVLGLLAFLWLAARLASTVWRGLTSPHMEHVPLDSNAAVTWIWLLACATALAAWFVHGLFDYFYEFTPTYVAFWLIAALAVRAAERLTAAGE